MQGIKNLTKSMYASLMWHSGLLSTWLKIRPGKSDISILNYHRIEGKIFEDQLRCLIRAFRVVTIEECCSYLRGLSRSEPNRVTITFDDAYEQFYHQIYPVLKKYNVPATVFLPTLAIDNREILWFDRVRALIQGASTEFIKMGDKTILLEPHRQHAYKQAIAFLNEQSVTERDRILGELLEDVSLKPDEMDSYRLLTWDQIRRMHGLITYGAHTLTHPNLSKLDRMQAKDEIVRSRNRIEEELGCKIEYFAYPFGWACHFTSETIELVREAQFECALTTIRGSCKVGDDLFTLRRMLFDSSVNGYVLITRLSSLWIFLTT